MAKKLILIVYCAFLLTTTGYSAELISGKVVDAQTGSPLSLCTVQTVDSEQSSISNESGIFTIKKSSVNETLLFTCPGYESLKLNIQENINPLVKLEPAKKLSNTAYSHDPYALLNKCLHNIRRHNKAHSTKTFVTAETYSSGIEPMEVAEAFYQAEYSLNKGISKITLKNGRFGIISNSGMLIGSLDAIKDLSSICLFQYSKDQEFPITPFGIKKNLIKECFELQILEYFLADNDLFARISFSPKNNCDQYFTGEFLMNVDKKKFSRIMLNTIDIKHHPFPPFSEIKQIDNIYTDYIFSFRNNQEGAQVLNFLSLNFGYTSANNKAFTTNATMVFYDHDEGFTPLLCDYSTFTSDYDMIMALPENEEFWQTNASYILNNKIEINKAYFNEYGFIINYNDDAYSDLPGQRLIIWEDGAKLDWDDINKAIETGLSWKAETQSADYFLDIQIVLDCNWVNDSLTGCCKTIFNKTTSFYKPVQNSQALEFINMQFDLAETVRRQMKQTIMKRNEAIDDISELRTIYNNYISRLKKTQQQMAEEVQYGNNELKMKEWKVRINNELLRL